LSIVASETDNIVFIFDKDGNLEWFNPAFTRLYGYTFEEFLLLKKSKNLNELSTNRNIHDLLEICITEGKTVVYESENITKNGEKVWVQTTLTPMLDIDNSVRKLIAIDSDITKIKQQEQEILQQSEEITAQRDALELQNQEILQQSEEIAAQRDALELQNQEIVKQSEHIEMQNQNIKASIRYALTIQKAFLPREDDLKHLGEHFILYKPKDIVSGDFYWMSIVEKTIFIAAVDCTGHGVPGAFMSMVGNRLLNEIVNEKHIFIPSEILTELNAGIYKVLRQDQSDNNDGMDLCLCKMEKFENETKITFCGARRPIFYYSKNCSELQTLKSDRKSIGGSQARNDPNKRRCLISLNRRLLRPKRQGQKTNGNTFFHRIIV